MRLPNTSPTDLPPDIEERFRRLEQAVLGPFYIETETGVRVRMRFNRDAGQWEYLTDGVWTAVGGS